MEALPTSSHNLYFCGEMRKISTIFSSIKCLIWDYACGVFLLSLQGALFHFVCYFLKHQANFVADDILKYLFLFHFIEKISRDISCESSVWHDFFSLKKTKKSKWSSAAVVIVALKVILYEPSI